MPINSHERRPESWKSGVPAIYDELPQVTDRSKVDKEFIETLKLIEMSAARADYYLYLMVTKHG
jgi:hypothetical protein